jgi:hypothetical protein
LLTVKVLLELSAALFISEKLALQTLISINRADACRCRTGSDALETKHVSDGVDLLVDNIDIDTSQKIFQAREIELESLASLFSLRL